MIEIVSKSGKKIGRISDDMNGDDTVYIDGRARSLQDVYNDPELLKKFNDEVKDLNNGVKLTD